MNPELSTTAGIVAALSMVGATVAAVAHAYALRHGLRTFRAYHLTSLVLASVYIAGYGWLAFTDVLPAEWSEALRWVALATWPLVWVVPAALSVVMRRGLRHAQRRSCE